MVRRFGLVVLVLATAAILVPSTAATLPTGAACAISGTATLKPGVTTKATSTTYTFSGNLGPCKSTDSTIKTGTVSASGSGKLSCVNGSSSATATVHWNNGKTSTASFTTKDVGSAVVVDGKVTSGEFAGAGTTSGVEGLLSFITTNVAACTKAGLTTLNFKGEVGVGTA
jgi:hypothetical protein